VQQLLGVLAFLAGLREEQLGQLPQVRAMEVRGIV
jgi:hypothetical protein